MNYSFILTEKCNWNCEYCAFPHIINPKETTEKIITKHLHYIKTIISNDKNVGYIDVQGGEIGLLPISTLKLFLKVLDTKVIICTNGMFIENEMYLDKDIEKYTSLIQWHLSQNLREEKIKDFSSHLDVSRGIVHNDVNEIEKFITRNKHIYFDYIDLEYNIINNRETNLNEYQKLYHCIENLENVSPQNLERIKDRFNEPQGLRNFCYEYNDTVVINLADESICLCQRAVEMKIPLTEENLLKRINTIPTNLFQRSIGCNSCTRLYAGARTSKYKSYIGSDQYYCKKFNTNIEGLYNQGYYKERNSKIIKILKPLNPKNIFEFASTYGFLAKQILNEISVNYLCTNFMPDVVDYIRNQGVPTSIFDADKIPQTDLKSYDTFICTSFEHLKNDLEIIKSLPPNSNLIFSVANFYDKNHMRLFKNEIEIIKRYNKILLIKKIDKVCSNERIKFVVYGVVK